MPPLLHFSKSDKNNLLKFCRQKYIIRSIDFSLFSLLFRTYIYQFLNWNTMYFWF
jgi:hypothetical protein